MPGVRDHIYRDGFRGVARLGAREMSVVREHSYQGDRGRESMSKRRLCRNYPRCPATTVDPSGYCDACRPAAEAQSRAQAARYDEARGTRSERGYDAAWYAPGGPRDRAMQATGGLCADCLERGHGVQATEVHHIDGNPRHNAPGNLRPVCKACHDARHGGRFRRRRAAGGGR